MADSYIQVPADDAGKKQQTFLNTVGANDVHAEGVVIVNAASGAEIGVATEAGNLATIAGDTTSLDGKVTACNTGAVTVSGALPAGANAIGKLAANSGVDIGDVDVTSISAGANIIGKVGIDQTTPGTTNRVDIGAALPIGANAIGKLAANSGVDIGDVDVTSVVPGVAATNLGKAEDAAHTTGDTGVMILGVRNDGTASLVNVDGDYTPLATDEYGRLKVVVTNQLNPISSANWKYAAINAAGAGDNTLVAAQGATYKIAVWSIMVISDGTVDVRFEDGAAGTAFTGQMPLLVNTGFTYSSGGLVPLWVGTANTLLNMELSAAVNVHGSLAYTVVT